MDSRRSRLLLCRTDSCSPPLRVSLPTGFDQHQHRVPKQLFQPHPFVFLAIWLGFTALTCWIAEHGIEQDSHRKLVILTTLGTILGPMTGVISRNCQSCCLAFSVSLLPYCGAFMVGGTLPLFIKLPFRRGASALRMAMWIVGLLGWFLGGIVSYGHALN